MHRLIDSIVIIVLLLTFIICGDELASTLGGTLIFTLLLSLIYFISYIYKKYHIELSGSGIIILSLILINYLNHLDKVNKIPLTWLVLIFCFLSLIIISTFIFLGLRPLRPSLTQTQKTEFVDMKKRIYERLALFPVLALGVFCIPTAFPYFIIGKTDYMQISNDLIRYIPIAVLWLTLSLVITLISLWKIRKNISILIVQNMRIKSNSYNKLFVIGMGSLILLGSGLEVLRGGWFVWIETILLFTLLFASLWCIWRFVLYTNTNFDTEVLEIPLTSLTRFKHLIIILLSYTILGSVYLICFSIFLLP